jgi:hypothetical protein
MIYNKKTKPIIFACTPVNNPTHISDIYKCVVNKNWWITQSNNLMKLVKTNIFKNVYVVNMLYQALNPINYYIVKYIH